MTAPKLRLAGFKEPWSPKRLGATGRILQERTSDFARYPLYSLTIEKGVTKKTERYERGFLVSKTGDIFKIVHPGNFVTNPMNLRFGAVGYSKEKDDVSVSGYYDVFELDDNKCSPFWFNFLKREEMKKRYEDIATGSLIEKKRVHVNDLLNLELPIPELDERKSLGEYLTSLDRLIDAEALRLESLRKLKVACLEKIFVHDGENCPRLRLSGFSGKWQIVKLQDIADKVTQKNQSLSITEVFTNSAEFGVISQRDFFNHDIAKKTNIGGYYVVAENDFVYNPRISKTAPVGPISCNWTGRKGVMSPLYTVFRTHDVDVAYLAYYFKTVLWHRFMRFTGNTGARFDRFSISDDDFFSMPIPLPPTMEEQRMIGAFFADMDLMIRLQAEKAKCLKHLRAGSLERMFV